MNTVPRQPVFLVLAAGYSRRFGGNKLAAMLPNGKTVLQASCDAIAGVSGNVLVVFNCAGPESQEAINKKTVASLSIPSFGMGDSIAAAVAHSANSAGWVLCLGDMPAIRTSSIGRLIKLVAQHPDNIIRPRFQGREGHPVFFPANYYDELCTLSGDVGARDIVRKHRDRLLCFDVDDSGVLRDIDYPSDLDNNNENL